MNTTITDRDMRDFVLRSIEGFENEFDVDAIVAAFIAEFGTVDLETVSNADYFRTVQQHAR